jgi:MinD-like ATPase involved in chromosome partitioning or flagellar assembly
MTDLLDLPDPAPLGVLTALAGPGEPALVEALEGDPRTRVTRRCADVAELLAAAEAGHGVVAVVSGDLQRLDADVVARLRRRGVRVIGVVDPDRDSRRRLRALGVDDEVAVAVPPAPGALDRVVAAVTGGSPAPAEEEGAGAARPDTRSTERTGAGPADPAGYADPAGARHLAGYSDPEGVGRRAREHRGDAPTPGDAGPSDEVGLLDDAAGEDGPRGRVVTVWGCPGAPGRTTLAVGLAAELAADGLSVVLVDADTHASSVASHLGVLDEAAGVVLAARAGLEGRLGPAALDCLAPLVLPRLRVLTGITRSARWPELRPAGLAAVLREARRVADVVVVDVAAPLDREEDALLDISAPRRNGAALTAVEDADVLLAVGAADPVGLQRLVRSCQELAALGLVTGAPAVVVNKLRASAVGPGPARRVRAALQRFAAVDDPVLLPWDPDTADAALLAGRTLAEAAPGSPLRAGLRRLAAELAGRPAPPAPRGRLGRAPRTVPE